MQQLGGRALGVVDDGAAQSLSHELGQGADHGGHVGRDGRRLTRDDEHGLGGTSPQRQSHQLAVPGQVGSALGDDLGDERRQVLAQLRPDQGQPLLVGRELLDPVSARHPPPSRPGRRQADGGHDGVEGDHRLPQHHLADVVDGDGHRKERRQLRDGLRPPDRGRGLDHHVEDGDDRAVVVQHRRPRAQEVPDIGQIRAAVEAPAQRQLGALLEEGLTPVQHRVEQRADVGVVPHLGHDLAGGLGERPRVLAAQQLGEGCVVEHGEVLAAEQRDG
ncbi:hypothetical protein GKE56_06725 [Nostocoides sp. HKS02]|nr:hypothetical protein GKE56_06725 [Tetrasphaera sp. HKS02]